MSLNKRVIAGGPPPEVGTFGILTWTGNGQTGRAISGLTFTPDFVWVKERSSGSSHYLHNTARGITKYLSTDAYNVEGTDSNTITNVFYGGFTVGSDSAHNDTNVTYVAWCWKINGGTTSSNTSGSITSTVEANTAAGISIVQYTGTQNNQSVGHGLGGAAEFIFVKAADAGNGWPAMHMGDGTNKYWGYRFNETGLDTGNGAGFWQNFTPNSTIFKVGASDESNRNGNLHIAYCFRSISGVSKFGRYTSNAGTKITTGFEPKLMMFKYANGGDWYIQNIECYDGATGSNGGKLIKRYLLANSAAAEQSVSTGGVEVMSDGFYPTNWFNTTSGTIYMAWG